MTGETLLEIDALASLKCGGIGDGGGARLLLRYSRLHDKERPCHNGGGGDAGRLPARCSLAGGNRPTEAGRADHQQRQTNQGARAEMPWLAGAAWGGRRRRDRNCAGCLPLELADLADDGGDIPFTGQAELAAVRFPTVAAGGRERNLLRAEGRIRRGQAQQRLSIGRNIATIE